MSNDPLYDATETELVPGALRGFRSWRYTNDPDMRLSACHFMDEWPTDRVKEAQHLGPQHLGPATGSVNFWGKPASARCKEPPVKGCTCGIYAAYNWEEADGRGFLLGSVKAYGKIILGTRGFRAAKAEIEALTVNLNVILGLMPPLTVSAIKHLTKRKLPELGDLYGVPTFESIQELLEEFPPVPVDHLLGDYKAEQKRKLMEFRREGLGKLVLAVEQMQNALKAFPIRKEEQ